MAKSTKTFSLEGDIVDKIVEYKKINNLSSDSAALERIILEFTYGVNSSIANNKLDNIEGLVTELLTRIDTKNSNIIKEVKVSKEVNEANEVARSINNNEILNIDIDKTDNELKCPKCCNESIEVEILISLGECYYCFCNMCDFKCDSDERKDSSKLITQNELDIFYINKMSGAM